MSLGAARQGISQAPPLTIVPLPAFVCTEIILSHNLTVQKNLKEGGRKALSGRFAPLEVTISSTDTCHSLTTPKHFH